MKPSAFSMARSAFLVQALLALACQSAGSGGGTVGRGGSSGVGTGGSAGTTAVGGNPGSGGTTAADAATERGGATGSGGTAGSYSGTGGTGNTAGTVGTGGRLATGGATAGTTGSGGLATGGATAGTTGSGGLGTGGATAGATGSGGFRTGGTAGTSTGTGGLGPATGGSTGSASGGRTGSGGATGLGGTAGSGGTTGSGGATGNGCDPADATVTINNTGPWNDTSGVHIQAHGGGLIRVCDTWYWFGEDKTLNTNGTGNFHAISCYASKDLVNWEHRNKVVTNNTDPVLNNTNLIIERPKVIYNASTKLYVMWAHWDMESCSGSSGGYCDSEAVVFTSPTVDGNYAYVKHFQPNGNGSRDCTLWQEPDGSAYFISTGAPNGNAGGFSDTEVHQLSSDYLTVTNTTKIWATDTREAYAFWKVNGKYYGVSSAQTGWAPNQAGYLTSTGTITGPWNNSFTPLGTNNSTWSSQPTYVIPIVGSQTTTYIYASDIWNSNNLSLSTYLWLPFTFDGTTWKLTYSATWSINLRTGVVSN